MIRKYRASRTFTARRYRGPERMPRGVAHAPARPESRHRVGPACGARVPTFQMFQDPADDTAVVDDRDHPPLGPILGTTQRVGLYRPGRSVSPGRPGGLEDTKQVAVASGQMVDREVKQGAGNASHLILLDEEKMAKNQDLHLGCFYLFIRIRGFGFGRDLQIG